MSKYLIGIRGAITVERDDSGAINEAVGTLADSLLKRNNLENGDIVSIQLTQTSDLRSKNAASALRASRSSFNNVPLFCSQEPDVEGMLERVIRILITAYGNHPPRHAYLGGAKVLRTEFAD